MHFHFVILTIHENVNPAVDSGTVGTFLTIGLLLPRELGSSFHTKEYDIFSSISSPERLLKTMLQLLDLSELILEIVGYMTEFQISC